MGMNSNDLTMIARRKRGYALKLILRRPAEIHTGAPYVYSAHRVYRSRFNTGICDVFQKDTLGMIRDAAVSSLYVTRSVPPICIE